MILTSIQILFILLIPAALGFLTVNILSFGFFTNIFILSAFSYLLGIGILSLLIFFLCLLNLKLALLSIGIAIFLLILFLFFILVRQKRMNQLRNFLKPIIKTHATDHKKGRVLQFITLVGIIYLFIQTFLVFWYALNVPVYTFDDFYHIATKGKVIYYTQSLQNLKYQPWPSYPLLIQLSQVFVSNILGRWDDQLIKIIFPLNFLSFLIIFIYFLTRCSSIRWGIAGGCLLISSLFLILHASLNYCDFYLSSFNCITIFLIIMWAKEKQMIYLLLAAFFSAIATFIKMEAAGYFFIHLTLILYILFKEQRLPWPKKSLNAVLFTIPAAVVLLTHNIFKIQQHMPIDHRTHIQFNAENISRIPSIIFHFIEVLLFNGGWQIVWFLLFLSLLKNIQSKYSFESKLLLLSLMMFIAFYIILGCFTNHYIYIGGESYDQVLCRLILHFYPLAPALVILLNYPKINKTRSTVLN